MVNFIKENGHARVASRYKTKEGYNLGRWVSSKRRSKKKKTLSQDHIARLDALDFK